MTLPIEKLWCNLQGNSIRCKLWIILSMISLTIGALALIISSLFGSLTQPKFFWSAASMIIQALCIWTVYNFKLSLDGQRSSFTTEIFWTLPTAMFNRLICQCLLWFRINYCQFDLSKELCMAVMAVLNKCLQNTTSL